MKVESQELRILRIGKEGANGDTAGGQPPGSCDRWMSDCGNNDGLYVFNVSSLSAYVHMYSLLEEV